MTTPVLFGEFLAQQALMRLRAAIAAAANGTPLKDIYVPETRHQEVPKGTLRALTLHFAGERGAGLSKHLPQLELIDTLHVNGFIAQGREEAVDLDQAVGELVQAVLDTLLEDTTFLQLFGWVEEVNLDKTDVAIGHEGTEYDTVIFTIVLELAGGQTTYTPMAGVPLQIVDIVTAPIVDGEPSDVTVESRIDLSQE